MAASFVAATVAACYRARVEGFAPATAGSTVVITNDGLSVMRIYDVTGYVGRVYPGETRCFRLRLTERSNALRAIIDGTSFTSPIFEPWAHGGWSWRIATTPRYDVLSLVPAEPCRR